MEAGIMSGKVYENMVFRAENRIPDKLANHIARCHTQRPLVSLYTLIISYDSVVRQEKIMNWRRFFVLIIAC